MSKRQLRDGNVINFLHLKSNSAGDPTIVFVHGFPLDHSMWNQQHPLQSVANLILPDLPGFGQSDSIDEISMESLADQIAELLKATAVERAIFCGLSMGGYIGWEFAKRHTDRLSGLICCNTRAVADDEATARARRVAAAQVVKTGSGAVAETMRSKLFSQTTITQNPLAVYSITDTIRRTSPGSVAAAQLAMSQRLDHSPTLPTINVPVLVIAGSEDQITPSAEMQIMAKQLKTASFVEIARSGHLSPLENPQQFNVSVANWLTEQRLRKPSL